MNNFSLSDPRQTEYSTSCQFTCVCVWNFMAKGMGAAAVAKMKVKKRDAKQSMKAKRACSGAAQFGKKQFKKHNELVGKIQDKLNKLQKVQSSDKCNHLRFLRATQKAAKEFVDMYKPLTRKEKAELREIWEKPNSNVGVF